jgi:hypothetical protein
MSSSFRSFYTIFCISSSESITSSKLEKRLQIKAFVEVALSDSWTRVRRRSPLRKWNTLVGESFGGDSGRWKNVGSLGASPYRVFLS